MHSRPAAERDIRDGFSAVRRAEYPRPAEVASQAGAHMGARLATAWRGERRRRWLPVYLSRASVNSCCRILSARRRRGGFHLISRGRGISCRP